jgi:S1-C subfamily serine protease
MSFDPNISPYGRTAYRPSPWTYLGPILILFGLVVLLTWQLGYWGRRSTANDPYASPRAVTARGDLAADEKSTIELFKSTSPSVVYITTLVRQRDYFTLNVHDIPQGTGSGFIWDKQGHVVTNYHVIRGAEAAKVTLADGSNRQAQLTGVAPDNDLAVLKIDAAESQLPAIDIGTSADLQVGQKVYAIGNPFGLDQTLTTGVVSAVGRVIKSATDRPISGVIQTDAAINPGNSGGPLMDSAGRLIGVNTAIVSPSGAYSGIGFAIPVDTVNRVVPQLIRRGRVPRPDLGVSFVAERQTRSRQIGIRNGLLILDVKPSSGAAHAGLRPTRRDTDGDLILGDVVIAIDGQPVQREADVEVIISKHQPGDTVKVTIDRDKVRHDISVQLIEA